MKFGQNTIIGPETCEIGPKSAAVLNRLLSYPTQYEPYFHSLGLGWKLSSFNPIVAAAKIK